MRRRLLILGLGLASALALFFAVRAVVFTVMWFDPDRGRLPVKGWMTPRYIARSYDLPREALADVLGLAPGETPRAPLHQIARESGVPVEALIARIEALLAQRPQP